MLMIDSNIWAYFFDSTLPEHKAVQKPVEDAINNEEVSTTTVIQMELMHYLVKRMGPVLGKEKMDVFLNYPFILDVLDRELVTLSLGILQRYSHMGIGARDASILASMKRHGVKRLMTHDRALKRVEDIEALDPIPA
jgi:predicted nucleic acid-binding protein